MRSPAVNSAVRADWFAARALLATRRLRPFAPLGVLAFALLVGAVFALQGPLADRAVAAQRAAARAQARTHDTLPLLDSLRAARGVVALRDSALGALLSRSESRATRPSLAVESQRARDSLLALVTALDGALDRASKAPLAESYRTLAGTRALRAMAEVRALVDSLDALDRMRLSLDPAATPQSTFAQLTERTNSIGKSLQQLARVRRSTLAAAILAIEGGAIVDTRPASPAEDTSVARVARDSAQEAMTRVEASLRETRRWLVANDARADSLARDRAGRILGASPMAAAIALLVLAGVVVFTLAVVAEARRPTIAHAREAERLIGVPVHAVTAEAVRDIRTSAGGERGRTWRARSTRLARSSIDPFRMVYLALTSSGTRERTVCVTGDNPDTVAIVAGRLASSAAADDRATLFMDLAPGIPAATRYFSARSESGFTEAIAGVHLWGEVARPVGASEGLSIDVVPAGAHRADTGEAVQSATNRNEFHLFASQYDFTVLAAPTRDSVALAAVLCPRPATVYVARVAETPLSALVGEVKMLKALDIDLYGILLVDWFGVDTNKLK